MTVFGFQSPSSAGQDLFSARFEPQILAAMSRHVALFPPARPDDSYPPKLHSTSPSSQIRDNSPSPPVWRRSQIPASKWHSLSPEKTATCTDDLKANSDTKPFLDVKDAAFGKCNKRLNIQVQRHQTMRYALNPVDFAPQHGTGATLRPAQPTLSNETLASLSTFCFPGIIVHRVKFACSIMSISN